MRLRKAPFPPVTVSGLWVDRASHDLIVYEENTRPEHQLVIIGHEAWHMFQGHGTSLTERGSVALRTGENQGTGVRDEFLAVVSEADDAELPPSAYTDAVFHFAARSDDTMDHEELEADHFGFRFATDVRAALEEARAAAQPHDLAARVQASLAHRFRRT